MQQREEVLIHLRRRNIHGLLAHERSNGEKIGGEGDIGYFAHNLSVFVDVAAHWTGSAIEFAGESVVHHSYLLRSRAVGICKEAACEQRHLQSFEISRRCVDKICSILSPGLFAIADGHAVVYGAFVREAQSDGGILNAGDLAHGGGALVQ